MTRFHQILVLSHVKAQKRPELTGKDHILQRTMATPQSLEIEITMCIMLRTDRQNHRTMVILGEDSDHHLQIIEEDIPDARQVHLEAVPIDGKVGTHRIDIAESDPLVREEATDHQVLEGVPAHLV